MKNKHVQTVPGIDHQIKLHGGNGMRAKTQTDGGGHSHSWRVFDYIGICFESRWSTMSEPNRSEPGKKRGSLLSYRRVCGRAQLSWPCSSRTLVSIVAKNSRTRYLEREKNRKRCYPTKLVKWWRSWLCRQVRVTVSSHQDDKMAWNFSWERPGSSTFPLKGWAARILSLGISKWDAGAGEIWVND
jgi:hypothetical protein